MEQELKKLDWFLKGPFFTMVPPPSPHESGQEFGEYLNEHNLTIISLDVVSKLRQQLKSKEKEMEDEKEEMMEQMKKLQIEKDELTTNQAKLVECVKKIAELTKFNESFGSEEFGKMEDLDRFYDHVKSVFKVDSGSPNPHSSSLSTVSTVRWDDEENQKVKRARWAKKSTRQPVFMEIERTDPVLPPLSPQPCSSSSLTSESESTTKWRCDWCMDRFDTVEEYELHRKIVYPVLAESRDHDESDPRYLTRAKSFLYRKYSHTPSLRWRKIKSDLQNTNELPADDDDDHIDGCDEDIGSEDEANGSDGSVNCRICGDPFDNMTLLMFHLESKHGGKGDAM